MPSADPVLPYRVVEFKNRRTGSLSWRVQGNWQGKRYRKNKADAASARALCDFKNGAALRDQTALPAPHLVATRLTAAEILSVESAIQKAAGRWPLAEVLEIGLATLISAPADVLLEPLFRAWLVRMKADLGERWLAEIEARGDYFFRANRGVTARRFTPEFFARWLSGLKCKGQTKANYRNALSRWATDMKTEGVFPVNPCKGMRIAKRKDKTGVPPVLSPYQAKAFLWVHVHSPELRRELGWVVECMQVGLRPQNEAPHAVWKEINLRAGEQHVLGYKRGVKPRIVTLQPVAVEWLRVVKRQRLPALAPYTRHLRERAVAEANDWLAKHHPDEPPIVWSEDILRHTFASMRAADGVGMDKLAAEMGTSTSMIYGHYRNVRPRREAAVFWALTPKVLGVSYPSGKAKTKRRTPAP